MVKFKGLGCNNDRCSFRQPDPTEVTIIYSWSLIDHSSVCAGIPELPGTTRNYPELGGTGSS